jgi:L-asparagine transporter-like permease
MTDQEQGLKRELTARQMAMVAVGGSIGTGLLLGSGAAIQVAGPAVVLTFILSALISWTVAMALGEMSAVHPAAGSFGVYADLYLNRWAGFIARYGYWFAVVIVVGSGWLRRPPICASGIRQFRPLCGWWRLAFFCSRSTSFL